MTVWQKGWAPSPWVGVGVGVGLIVASLAAAPGCARPSPTGVALDRAVREPSGLVASGVHEGVFWTHGDSGNGNALFAVSATGELRARYQVKGAQNIDWEDITRDSAGNLWLGDIGNNEGERKNLEVHRLPEPDPSDAEAGARVDRSVPFHYPDQKEFGRQDHEFDAESLMWWDGTLWVWSKGRRDRVTKLYRFPKDAVGTEVSGREGEEVALELIGVYDLAADFREGEPRSDFPARATGADASPDGKRWAVLSYEAITIFDAPAPGASGPELAAALDSAAHRITLDPSYVIQIEALAWDGDDLLLCNEERALFRIEAPMTVAHYPVAKTAPAPQ